jgi:hypothetical protein
MSFLHGWPGEVEWGANKNPPEPRAQTLLLRVTPSVAAPARPGSPNAFNCFASLVELNRMQPTE